MRRLLPIASLLALLLAAAPAALPAAAAEGAGDLADVALEECLVTRWGTLCHDTTPHCPSAWYTPPWTDFGAGASSCLTGAFTPDAVVLCETLVAGYWTLAGFFGVDQATCVAYVDDATGATCVYAWGRSGDVQWYTEPVCV